MDVDGTMTDGNIYMSANGEAFKAFNIKDGYTIYIHYQHFNFHRLNILE